MPSEKDIRQADFFRNRVAKNEKALRRWVRASGLEAMRLYDRDIPEIPLALDRYGDALLLALYERPYEKDEALERMLVHPDVLDRNARGLQFRFPCRDVFHLESEMPQAASFRIREPLRRVLEREEFKLRAVRKRQIELV